MTTALSPVRKKQSNLRNNLRRMLTDNKDQFAMALGEQLRLNPEQLIRVAITAATMNPKLLDCTQESVALALLNAASTGLPPDGYHAHLIPYGKTCQFIPDYKGLVQLGLENDVVIDAYCVHEKDEFEYQLGTDAHIKHRPSEEDDRGPLRCAYAIATFGNGRQKFVVATRSEVMKRKAASRSSGGADSPWTKWEPEMWQKTAVKMLSKFVPRSPEMRRAIRLDDMAETGTAQRLSLSTEIEETLEPSSPPKGDEVAARLEETPGKTVAEPKIRKDAADMQGGELFQ